MKFVSESGFTVDDVYFTALAPTVWLPTGDRLKVAWTVDIKPLAADDILWAAFLPDVQMGPRMRLNRRINGAFQVAPLRIADGVIEVDHADDPYRVWQRLLAQFDGIRTDFVSQHPTVEGFLNAIRAASHDGRSRFQLREIVTLIAAGYLDEAIAMADSALSAGEGGGMYSSADVYEYLLAYAKGAPAWHEFLTSLVPTHDLTVVSETSRTISIGLSRSRDQGRFLRHLEKFDGVDVWAMILETRVPPGAIADSTSVRYLQAAGTAAAMTVEIRQPGGHEHGDVSVRSVVGKPHTGPAVFDVAIVLPRSTECRARHEVFTAAEAADLFEKYYLTNELDNTYLQRPVELYGKRSP